MTFIESLLSEGSKLGEETAMQSPQEGKEPPSTFKEIERSKFKA